MTSLSRLTALATFIRDCAVDGSSLICKLGGVLRGLEMTAAALGGVLLLVVVLAMLVYHRKKCGRSEIL